MNPNNEQQGEPNFSRYRIIITLSASESRSTIEGGCGFAAVMRCQPWVKDGYHESSGFEPSGKSGFAEMRGLLMCLKRLTRPHTITIQSRSKHVIGIMKWLVNSEPRSVHIRKHRAIVLPVWEEIQRMRHQVQIVAVPNREDGDIAAARKLALNVSPSAASPAPVAEAEKPIAPKPVEVLPEVLIYTDGSCVKNPGGAGGFAAVIRSQAGIKELSGHIPAPTTNNRAEFFAVIAALRNVTERSRITVKTDSMILVKLLNREGKPAHKRDNQDLVQAIVREMERHDVRGEWVRGHGLDSINCRCDRLAYEASAGPRDLHEPLPVVEAEQPCAA